MAEHMIELTGTKAEVQKMLNVASRVEPGCFKKKWINEGQCNVWFNSDGNPNDLLAAIRKKAGLGVSGAVAKKEAGEAE